MNGQVVWAHQQVPEIYPHLWEQLEKVPGCQPHWSRIFEYPWVVLHGDFRQGQEVLDAGGGEGPLQYYLAEQGCHVTNADDSFAHTITMTRPSWKWLLTREPCNIRLFPKDWGDHFDRVLCVSVLEHDEDPLSTLDNLWRVTASGGRLLVTLDVAGYQRWNHITDQHLAKKLLAYFDLQLPPEPEDLVVAHFDEIERIRWEPERVSLRVLCFWVDKPE